jgi:hypothetical protein
MPETNNVYDTRAPQFIAKGLWPLPIGPGTKKPQVFKNNEWVGLPLWTTRGPITTPQPGAGIGLLMGKNISAIDLDNDEIALALYDVLPDTPCRKYGQRGETLFYFAPGLPSKKYKINGQCVVEVLGVGSQSVLPPSIHPDTHQEYRWTGTKTLDDIKEANELPFLFTDIFETIEKVLANFGWKPEPERPASNGADHKQADSDTLFRALNEMALGHLAQWVPSLGLFKFRRRVGRYDNYEAVAAWRPSTKGRPLQERSPNLRISSLGIRDFGDGRTYTPIDLVMAAKACNFNAAVAFLDECLEWSKSTPKIDVEPPKASSQNKPTPEPAPESEPDTQDKDKAAPRARRPELLSSAAFIRDFVPPDYLVDGLLQLRFIYAFTAMTGHGKTTVVLRLMACVALGCDFAGRACEQGSVLFLAGENPDDVRMRWIGLAEYMSFDPTTIDVHFVPGVFPISTIRAVVATEAKKLGKQFKLVIVDTSAAYFTGSEENNNAQLGNHARDMRHHLISLPGYPTVLVTCHPIKNPDLENLLPRGGGGYVAEMDGNLTGQKDDTIVTVYWAGKFRGPDFEPMQFQLVECHSAKLVDSKGRPIPTVVAKDMSDQEYSEIRTKLRREENIILAIMVTAGDDELSLADMAQQAGWLTRSGEPAKRKAHCAIIRLQTAKLVKRERGAFVLTDAGKRAAERARTRGG